MNVQLQVVLIVDQLRPVGETLAVGVPVDMSPTEKGHSHPRPDPLIWARAVDD